MVFSVGVADCGSAVADRFGMSFLWLGCYVIGYSISAAVCGEGTVYVCLDASGCAHAHAHTFAKFAPASANVDARSRADADSHTSH